MVKTKDTDMPLSKTEMEVYAQQLISEWKNQVRTAMETSFKNKEITIGSNTMKLAWTVYGEKPQDGYPLYISLHGGGGLSAEENDEQWYNQQRLYDPYNAVYLAPRATLRSTLYERVIHLPCSD